MTDVLSPQERPAHERLQLRASDFIDQHVKYGGCDGECCGCDLVRDLAEALAAARAAGRQELEAELMSEPYQRKGALILNSYGRRCWDSGHAAAETKAEAQVVALTALRDTWHATACAKSLEERNLRAEVAALTAALKEAVESLRVWHGIWHGKEIGSDAEAGIWELYQSSPEMVRINAALESGVFMIGSAPLEPETIVERLLKFQGSALVGDLVQEAADRIVALQWQGVTDALQIAKGIRMLGVTPREHPQHAVFNEALQLAAAYVEQAWGCEGRGARASAPDPIAPRPEEAP